LKGQEDIFFDHLLKIANSGPVPRIHDDQVWPSVFLFACLVMLVIVKVRSFPKVTRIVQSTFSPQILQQLEREERNPFRFYALALNILFILNVAFLCYKINTIYRLVLTEQHHFAQFCFFAAMIVLLAAFKTVINSLLHYFTERPKIFSDYSVSNTLVNQTFGLFLFPWIVLMQFSDFNPLIFIYAGLAVLAASMLIKWYRGLLMGMEEERIGVLQIFSYFCGLEILPVLVLVKYLIETF
jgi:hypothetical protein